MINWPAEGNDYYVNLIEMTPDERDKALEAAKLHTLQFVYFIQKELGMDHLGLADDEYPSDDLLPFIPYHRESRRIHGETRFTLNHAFKPYDQQQPLYRTSIAVGDYPVDHHHKAYHGEDPLPDLHFYPIPSFGLPAGVLVPTDVDDMIVAEKSISVTNLMNGSTRLQPVVMQIGQASGALAALAVKEHKAVRDVSVRELQQAVLDGGGYLQPYLDRKPTDRDFAALQRIGSTGILQAEGRSVGWSNQTWLRADTLLTANELEGFTDYYPHIIIEETGAPITVAQAEEYIRQAARGDIESELKAVAANYGISLDNPNRPILRGEFAVLVDGVLHPFDKAIGWDGEFEY
jgi:hypothetical protein